MSCAPTLVVKRPVVLVGLVCFLRVVRDTRALGPAEQLPRNATVQRRATCDMRLTAGSASWRGSFSMLELVAEL